VNAELETIVEAMPYITFLFLFQPNVPQTFQELNHDQPQVIKDEEMTSMDKDKAKLKKIDKVLRISSIAATIVFTIVGVYGYLTFSNS